MTTDNTIYNSPFIQSPFTGTVVTPTDVSYYYLSFSTNTNLYWPSVVNSEQVPASRIMDIVATTTGLSIVLPDATQGSLGSDILFRNLGSNAVNIVNFVGGGSVNILPGVAVYFYLTDNTTQGGVWSNVTFGAGTSFADAATLAGAGLSAEGGKLVTSENIIAVTSPPTLSETTRASTIIWNGGTGTINLPSTSTINTGWYIGFRNNGTGTLTLAPQSPSQINNAPSISTNPGDSGWIIYQPQTSSFFTVGLATPTNVTFTSAVYDVDAIPGNTFNLVQYAPIIETYVSNSGTRTQTLNVVFPAVTQIYILSNSTGSSAYNLSFSIEGSSAAPLTISNGQIITVLSDGNTLFPLTSSTTNVFYAQNGSAGSPSFSFTTDVATGMYLQGTSILGLTANSAEIMKFDGSNSLSPQVSTPAQFNAALISGGQF